MIRYDRHTFSLRILLPLVLFLGMATGVFLMSALGSSPADTTGTSLQQPVRTLASSRELLNQFSAAFEDAAAKVNPSVVPIFSEQTTRTADPFTGADDPFRQFFGDDFFHRFFGGSRGGQNQTVRSLGSGVIVSSDGYILTNNHVVDGAEKLTVVLNDKKKYTAKIVGRDPQSDVAVVKIDAKDLPAATLGNSDDVKIGEWVIAVGNPFQLMHTVTAGIISAKGRSSVNLAEYEDFIQTDASINPGNSGGALADLEGHVIGINTAIISPSGAGGNVGIGFAIPVNMARSLMERLIAHGKVSRGYLGLVPQDIDETLARALKLSTTEGALVVDVSRDGPADRAGIKRQDIITGYNGKKVESSTELRSLVAAAEPGSEASVKVLRDGDSRTFSVKLGERPSSEKEGSGADSGSEASGRIGLAVRTLKPDIARQLGVTESHGVVVESVTAGSPAEEAGIQRGDIVLQVNSKGVKTAGEYQKALESVKKGEPIAFLVRRGEATFFAAIQMP